MSRVRPPDVPEHDRIALVPTTPHRLGVTTLKASLLIAEAVARLREVDAYVRSEQLYDLIEDLTGLRDSLDDMRSAIVTGFTPIVAGRDFAAELRDERPLLDAIERAAERPAEVEDVYHDDYDRAPEPAPAPPAAKPKRGRAAKADRRTKARERDPALAWRAIPLEQLDLPQIVKTILFRAGCSIAGQVADWFDTEMSPERTMARLNRPNADHEHTLEAVRVCLLAIRDGAAVAKPAEPSPDEPTPAPVESPGEAIEAPPAKRKAAPGRTPKLKPAALDPLETDPADLDKIPVKMLDLPMHLPMLLYQTGNIRTVGQLVKYLESGKKLTELSPYLEPADEAAIRASVGKYLADVTAADPDPEPAAKSFPLQDWTVRRKHNPIAVVQADGHDDAWNKAAATFGAVGITVSWGRPATGRFAAKAPGAAK
jgi:hypothetical protein